MTVELTPQREANIAGFKGRLAGGGVFCIWRRCCINEHRVKLALVNRRINLTLKSNYSSVHKIILEPNSETLAIIDTRG